MLSNKLDLTRLEVLQTAVLVSRHLNTLLSKSRSWPWTSVSRSWPLYISRPYYQSQSSPWTSVSQSWPWTSVSRSWPWTSVSQSWPWTSVSQSWPLYISRPYYQSPSLVLEPPCLSLGLYTSPDPIIKVSVLALNLHVSVLAFNLRVSVLALNLRVSVLASIHLKSLLSKSQSCPRTSVSQSWSQKIKVTHSQETFTRNLHKFLGRNRAALYWVEETCTRNKPVQETVTDVHVSCANGLGHNSWLCVTSISNIHITISIKRSV